MSTIFDKVKEEPAKDEPVKETPPADEKDKKDPPKDGDKPKMPPFLAQAPEKYRGREELYQLDTLGKWIEDRDSLLNQIKAKDEAANNILSSIPKLKEEMTPEEIAAFRKHYGVPEKADEYKLPETATDLAGAFLEANLTPIQAKKLAGKWDELLKAQSDAQAEIVKMDQSKTVTIFRAKYGDDWQKKIDIAEKAAKSLFPEGVLAILSETGALNKVEMLDTLINIGEKYIKEDRMLDGSSVDTQPTNGFQFDKMPRANPKVG